MSKTMFGTSWFLKKIFQTSKPTKQRAKTALQSTHNNYTLAHSWNTNLGIQYAVTDIIFLNEKIFLRKKQGFPLSNIEQSTTQNEIDMATDIF